MAQLGLLLAFFDAYRIETRSFRILVLLATAALPAHYLAPYRWKKPLFVAVSILGMVLINGLSTAGGVLAVSAVLLILAAAPLRWSIRAGLIAALALCLAVLRARAAVGSEAIASGVIPIVATMFMFRMIVYLYERKHAGGREPLFDTLSYFFLLPKIHPSDFHPNAQGHALLARRLAEALWPLPELKSLRGSPHADNRSSCDSDQS